MVHLSRPHARLSCEQTCKPIIFIVPQKIRIKVADVFLFQIAQTVKWIVVYIVIAVTDMVNRIHCNRRTVLRHHREIFHALVARSADPECKNIVELGIDVLGVFLRTKNEVEYHGLHLWLKVKLDVGRIECHAFCDGFKAMFAPRPDIISGIGTSIGTFCIKNLART